MVVHRSLSGILLFGNWAAARQKQQNDPCAQRRLRSALNIRTVWSEFSLSAWRTTGPLTTNRALSEDSDQTGRMPKLIWVFAGRTYHFDGFVVRRHNCVCQVGFVLSSIVTTTLAEDGAVRWADRHLSRDSTIPTNCVCAQQRLRSAWASAQTYQSLRCVLSG